MTSTAAELNILDGVTSTAAELNLLDGVTSTTTELNMLDMGTVGIVQNSRAVTTNANGETNFYDKELQKPLITDYAETLNALGDVGGGTDAINIESGNVVTATVSTATQTFTFTNPSATGKACSFTLILTNGGFTDRQLAEFS